MKLATYTTGFDTRYLLFQALQNMSLCCHCAVFLICKKISLNVNKRKQTNEEKENKQPNKKNMLNKYTVYFTLFLFFSRQDLLYLFTFTFCTNRSLNVRDMSAGIKSFTRFESQFGVSLLVCRLPSRALYNNTNGCNVSLFWRVF